MLFDVYNLGTDKGADAMAALKAGARRGELRISRRFPNAPHDTTLEARLCAPGTRDEIMGPLLYVQWVAMNQHGFVIEGTEVVAKHRSPKSSVNHYKVRWLCKLPGAPAVLNAAKISAHQAKRLQDMRSNPFHEAFDDDVHLTSSYGPEDV